MSVAGTPSRRPITRGDAALREMDAAGFRRQTATLRRFIDELGDIDRGALTFDQDIDYRFLEGTLRADLLVAENVQRWRQDPRLYFNNGPIVYKISVDPRPPAARAADLIDDLQLLQTRLTSARANLDQYIARWIELTDQTLVGFQSVLANDLPAFAERVDDDALRDRLLAESGRAADAMARFRAFLREDLPRLPEGDWRVGAEVFNGLQEHRYMFPENDIHLRRIARGQESFTRVPGYHDWGWKQFDIIRHHLEVKARRIDPERTWLEIIKDEKQDHFFAEQLVFKHLEAARRSRDWVIENDLVSIPWDDDDSIMAAADPQHVGIPVVGVRAGRVARLAESEVGLADHPGVSRLAGRDGGGEPDREGSLVHVRHHHPRGLSWAPPAEPLSEGESPPTASLSQQLLLQSGLVLLHRMGADAPIRSTVGSPPTSRMFTSLRHCASSCGASAG